MNDDVELRLRAAFRGQLPSAPITLEDALERVTQEPVTALRGRSRAPWALLGVAALLATGLVVGLTAGSRNGLVAPSATAPPSAEATAASASEATALELTFEARPVDGSEPDGGVMDQLVATIRGRLELSGDAAVTVTRVGGPRVVVRIPAGIDPDEVRAMLGHAGRVDVVPLGQDPLTPGTMLDPAEHPTLLERAAIDTAEAGTDDNGAPELTLRLTDEGATVFADFSADHVGEFVALTVDHLIVVAPMLNEAITDGVIEITSGPDGMDADELRRLVGIINGGGPLFESIPFVEISPTPSAAP
jgi:hypothetical protein